MCSIEAEPVVYTGSVIRILCYGMFALYHCIMTAKQNVAGAFTHTNHLPCSLNYSTPIAVIHH